MLEAEESIITYTIFQKLRKYIRKKNMAVQRSPGQLVKYLNSYYFKKLGSTPFYMSIDLFIFS